MEISYDNKRKDITFCTMLFKIPSDNNEGSLKREQRDFKDFYLLSLEKLIRTFKKVALWCDEETAAFLKEHGLDKNILMRVMKFSELPHYPEREQYKEILSQMQQQYRGFLLRRSTPDKWPKYMTVVSAKPAIISWAAQHDKFNSDYFMWIDAGSFNPMYKFCWADWTGKIQAKPDRCRFSIAPTLGKTRPKFVPRFIYKMFTSLNGPIKPATGTRIANQNMIDIAVINADYDVPGGSFIIPKKWVSRFEEEFERARLIMKKHGLVSVEQAIFQTMMKFDICGMFELVYIRGYDKLYTQVSKASADYIL